mmetsp:Transcript_5970/g.11654  ORF Transcript_5970/g.11654 Transcript_5970/m.11654 type:complete len:87 (+) Transcript_5970:1096-1356(+)
MSESGQFFGFLMVSQEGTDGAALWRMVANLTTRPFKVLIVSRMDAPASVKEPLMSVFLKSSVRMSATSLVVSATISAVVEIAEPAP